MAIGNTTYEADKECNHPSIRVSDRRPGCYEESDYFLRCEACNEDVSQIPWVLARLCENDRLGIQVRHAVDRHYGFSY